MWNLISLTFGSTKEPWDDVLQPFRFSAFDRAFGNHQERFDIKVSVSNLGLSTNSVICESDNDAFRNFYIEHKIDASIFRHTLNSIQSRYTSSSNLQNSLQAVQLCFTLMRVIIQFPTACNLTRSTNN